MDHENVMKKQNMFYLNLGLAKVRRSHHMVYIYFVSLLQIIYLTNSSYMHEYETPDENKERVNSRNKNIKKNSDSHTKYYATLHRCQAI